MEPVGSGTESGCCCGGWGSNRTRSTSWWTSIMRWSIWARSRPCSAAGRRRSVRRGSVASGGAAERRSRGGASGDRCRVWFSPRQGVETGARILQTERRKRSDGLRTDSSVEVADRQWCDRECDSPCREPAVEGAEHLLAQDDCGGRSAVTFVLQGGTLESS